jgi:tetratricopeptide (TPR) repeat protein
MSTARAVKVFIASPNDLAIERRAFKEVVDELSRGFGRGAHVTFEPVGWEDALATIGQRSQSVINQDIDACDVFVLVMWLRWGQPAPDAEPYSSYTEEEFYRALARYEREAKPTVFVFFKHIEPPWMADPGPQLEKVLAFRRKLEQTRKVLYRSFDDEKSFRLEIDKHLTAYVDGKFDTPHGDRLVPIIPDSIQAELDQHRAAAQSAVDELEKLRAEAKLATEEAERARAEAKDAAARAIAAERVAETTAAGKLLALAEEAAKAALDGRIEEARQGFAKALDGTTNVRVLFLGFEFFKRLGELAEAERLLRRSLAISGPEVQTASTADAYSNLGIIMGTRGNLDGAEAMHHKALDFNAKLGRLEGTARAYNNLGIILRTRGDLDGAEAMHRKSLEINEKLGRPQGTAINYGNLGLILQLRGDLAGAEAMHRKSLEIEERLGRLEGMAKDYGNIGLVLQTRGDLEGAEAMHRKALEINEKLGRLEGMANAYGNLCLVLQKRGDLDGAEAMCHRSFGIEEKLGRLEGMANDYENLALIKKTRGDLDGARENWSKSRDLFARLGARHMVERVQKLIDGLSG